MSTLKVNNIESFTGANPVTINDELQISGSSATGLKSFSHGQTTIASGINTHAEGLSTKASGSYSHAEGRQTLSIGQASHAQGYLTTSSGNFSFAAGQNTEAHKLAQAVFGVYNKEFSQPYAFIIGNGNFSTRKNLAVFATASILFDTGSIPTSSLGLSTGQLYRTGSSLDEIKIKL